MTPIPFQKTKPGCGRGRLLMLHHIKYTVTFTHLFGNTKAMLLM